MFIWIGLVIVVIFNILILISGKNQPDNVKSPKILLYMGLINIIFYLITMGLPVMLLTGLYTPLEEQMYIAYSIFKDVITFLPFLISYGIGFYLFGVRNKELYNNYLKFAGITFVIIYLLMGIILLSNFYDFLYTTSGLDVATISLIYIIITVISNTLGIVAVLFILLHSTKFKDNYLLVGSILWLIMSGISFVMSLVVIPI